MNDLRPWLDTTVLALRELSPTVREFRLRRQGVASSWTVGSHLLVQIVHADGRVDERHYSLVGAPGAGADWRIAVKRAEPSRGGSAFMWQLKVGDTLAVQPPHNHFELPPNAAQTLLVAGGIGITPIVGMALSLAARRADVQLCYAARSFDELVYESDLRAALGERLFTFIDSEGQRLDLDAQIAALHPQGQMLICGPVPLLHAAQAAWARAGRPPQRLRFETFGNTGAKPAEAFWVRVPRHGLQLEVPADRSLLEVLEAHGVQVLYDCKRGECGLCVVDVESVEGEIDHRDVFFSVHEKGSNQKLCACVSRACGGGVVIDSAFRPDSLASTSEETSQ